MALPFTHKAIQGFQIIYTITVVDDSGNPMSFTGSEPLAATVWSGGQQASLFSPTVAWNSAADGTIDITYSVASTQNLAIGFYDVLVSRSDVNVAFATGYLEVTPAPGTASTDLCTIPFARMALASYTFTLPQLDFLPTAISVVSQAIKRYCGDRDFIQQDYVREFDIDLSGSIMVDQLPLNQIKRIQISPASALYIQNTASGATDAWVYFAMTGDVVTGQTVTGITLNVINSGVQTTTTIAFTANETINSLATAISAAGNGWAAQGDSAFGTWPVTELIGTERPGGALTGSLGAVYDVYSQDIGQDAVIDPTRTGLVWIGRQYRGAGPRWGPDWMQFDAPRTISGRAKVTYNAGLATVPRDVQWIAADLARRFSILAATDPTVASETIEQFSTSYRQVLDLMTPAHRQALSLYRIPHA